MPGLDLDFKNKNKNKKLPSVSIYKTAADPAPLRGMLTSCDLVVTLFFLPPTPFFCATGTV